MPFEQNLQTFSAQAGSDLSAKQFYACQINNAGKIALATAAKNIDGILQDKPTSGQAGELAYDGITKAAISASQNVAIGDLLEVDTGGTLTVHASGTVVAKALEATNVAHVVVIAVKLMRSNALFS